MSGYRSQQRHSPIPDTGSDDDDVYLKMNQFQNEGNTSSPRASNMLSELNNVLARNKDHRAVAPQSIGARAPNRNIVTLARQPGRASISVNERPSDWPTSGLSPAQQARRHSAIPSLPQWDRPQTGNRPAPPTRPLVPQRLPDGFIDDEPSRIPPFSGLPERKPYPGSMATAKNPNVPLRSLHGAGIMLPRMPLKPATRSPYDDHCLPFGVPLSLPRFPPPKRPEVKSFDSAVRHASLKDEHVSHVPDRRYNHSTGSIGSAPYDQTAIRFPRPSSNLTTDKFVQARPMKSEPTQFPEIGSRTGSSHRLPPAVRDMPSFHTQPPMKSAGVVEEQAWFFNVNRKQAQDEIKPFKQDGMFLVRPSSKDSPYALTLYANGTFYNLEIRVRGDGKYALGTAKDNELSHTTVLELIEYHQKYEVKVDKGGCVILTVPPPLTNT